MIGTKKDEQFIFLDIHQNPPLMQTILLKTTLIVIPLSITVSCFSQNNKTRKVYEYVMQQDSVQNRKVVKLKSVKKEKYTETGNQNLQNTVFNSDDLDSKDKNCDYKYEAGKKSVSVKKLDKKTKEILAINNVYFGNNNKIYDETFIDKSNDSYFSKHYLYSRQGRLVKIISYSNGKENGYTLYEYNDENKEGQFSKL